MSSVRELLEEAIGDVRPQITLGDLERRVKRYQSRRRARVSLVALAGVVGISALIVVAVADNPGPSIRTANSAPGWVTYRDRAQRFSVRIPPGWTRAPLGPVAIGSGDVLFVESPERSVPGACAAGSSAGFVSGDQVAVELAEFGSPPTPSSPRPVFGPQTGPGLGAPLAHCPGGEASPIQQRVTFSDHGRTFMASLLVGPTASQQRVAEAYAILNSLHFGSFTLPYPRSLPATTQHRRNPGQAITVAVANASGVGGAALTVANVLRGSGYTIVSTGNASTPQTGTTVACRAGMTTEAAALARTVGRAATVQSFPNPPPSTAVASDCVVTIGE